MKINDVSCPNCNAGFRRLELSSMSGCVGEFECPSCAQVIETCDGAAKVVYRLTVMPSLHVSRKAG